MATPEGLKTLGLSEVEIEKARKQLGRKMAEYSVRVSTDWLSNLLASHEALRTELASERSSRERAERDAEAGWNAAGSLRVYRDELLATIAAYNARKFPIMDGQDIPWSAIAPFEKHAQQNHGGQTLERLAQRGGLSVSEAIHVLRAQRWDNSDASRGIFTMPRREAILELEKLVRTSEGSPSSPAPVIAATDEHPAIYRVGHKLTASPPSSPVAPTAT